METLNQFDDEDALSELLRSACVRSTIWCRSEMTAPWGFGVPAMATASFHLMVKGEAWLQVDGADVQLRLSSGDLVLLPNGAEHQVRDTPGSPIQWLEDILATNPELDGRLSYGGGGRRSEIVCGGFQIEPGPAARVLSALPTVVLIKGSDGRPVEWVAELLALLRRELQAAVPGRQAVIGRLTDVLLSEAVRLSVSGKDELETLMDHQIGAALKLMHDRPDEAWTVERLAAKVAMSRSAFSARFKEVTGQPPMGYLRGWRLGRAAQWLHEGDMSVWEIAKRIGYESEAALSRAFKREFDIAPGLYRKTSA